VSVPLSRVVDRVKVAEDDGFEAFVNGLNVGNNPMPASDIERQYAWQRGWHEARVYIAGWKGEAA
jgi:hypothetical protein